LSTAIDRQEQKDLIKKGQSGIATSINLILNRMAIAILPPLKQFRRHQLVRKKNVPQTINNPKIINRRSLKNCANQTANS
jgi:hypothetical protein